MTTNTRLIRETAYPAVLECSYPTPGKVNASTAAKLKARGAVRGAQQFAIIESSISTIRPKSVTFTHASFELNETQAVEFARALLGPGYRVERVE